MIWLLAIPVWLAGLALSVLFVTHAAGTPTPRPALTARERWAARTATRLERQARRS